ncbi:MAG TPA: hypothetical protein VGB55_06980 [Tepidisphaeraceae bacterium]|jgi:hypothetical protein
MDKKTYSIGILSVIATLLLVGNLLPLPQADAGFSTKDNRFQLISTRSVKGGESLYVIDNTTGQVAVLVFDNNALKPIVIEPLTNLFK